MNKLLLLICCILCAGLTLAHAQSDVLGNAGSYAVLASSQVNNSGVTGVTGNLGVSPGSTINGEAGLVVKSGKIEKNTASAISAQADALIAYNALYARTPTKQINGDLGASALPLGPGVYKISGDASFKGVLTLDGKGDLSSSFVFIIDGDLLTDAPAAGVLAMGGAQPGNIYWVVNGNVNLGGSTGFQGTILADGSITLASGVVVIGRVQSISNEVNLTYNNIFLPNVVVTDLGITKEAAEGNYTIGSEVVYTITAHNNGPGTATDVEVQEQIPAGLELVEVVEASQGAYNQTTNIWRVGTLENGGTATLKLKFRITQSGEIKNKVTIISRDPDPNPDDNKVEVPINVTCEDPKLAITGDAAACQGDELTYTITEVLGGTYNYTLPDGFTEVSRTATTITVKAGSQSGELQVSVQDQCGDTYTATLAITVTPELAQPTISGPATACANQAGITYTVTNPAAGATYEWILTGDITKESETATSITINAGANGGTIAVKASNSCFNATSEATTITVTPELAQPTISGAATACANQAGITYTVTNPAEGATYEWILTGDITKESETATSVTINAGANGGTIAVKASNSCFNATSEVSTISITPVPATPAFVTSSAAVCETGEALYEVSEVEGATGYTWTLPEGWEITSGEGTNRITVKAGTAAGNITVTADNACGSSEAAIMPLSSLSVTETPTITGPEGGCVGETIIYSISEVDDATGYNWTVPQGWRIVSGENTATIEVEVGNEPGNITASITNSCGTSQEATIAVSPYILPLEVNISGPEVSCATSADNVYTVTEVLGATYNWSVPQGWTITAGENTNSITVTAGSGSGEVTVIVATPCSETQTITFETDITIAPASAGIIIDNSTLCDGLAYSIDAVPGATTYTWSVPAGTTIISGQGTPSIKVKADNNQVTGDIKVIATTGACSSPEAVLTIDLSKIDGGLNFPKAFSPNGDGKNDVWSVANLDKYASNEVIIFNRWGSEVYRKKNYNDNWAGNGLEEGTYFYKVSVELCSGKQEVFTGYVTIFK